MSDSIFPKPRDDDDDDVAWNLQTAGVQWGRGAHADALVWLGRAIEAAQEAGQVQRAHELQLQANEIAANVAPESVDRASGGDGVDDLIGVKVDVSEGAQASNVFTEPSPYDAFGAPAASADAEPEVQSSQPPAAPPASPTSSRPAPARTSSRRPPPPSLRPPKPSAPAIDLNSIIATSVPPVPSSDGLEPVDQLVAPSVHPGPSSGPPEDERISESPASGPSPLDTIPPVGSLADTIEGDSVMRKIPKSLFPEEEATPVSSPTFRPSAKPTPIPQAAASSAPPEPEGTEPEGEPEAPASEDAVAPEAPEGGANVDGISLEQVRGFEDLPEEEQAALAAAARIEELGADEEVGFFGAALVTRGRVDILPAIADEPGASAGPGDVVFTRGSMSDEMDLRVVASEPDTRIAVWTKERLDQSMADCPWVADDLRVMADRYQALTGATLGPLADRLDRSLRDSVTERMEVVSFEPGQIMATAGEPLAGLYIVGGGRVEVLTADGEVAEELGPGDFLFPTSIMSGIPAAATARAGNSGALALFASRHVAHELMTAVPPLLEVLATT